MSIRLPKPPGYTTFKAKTKGPRGIQSEEARNQSKFRREVFALNKQHYGEIRCERCRRRQRDLVPDEQFVADHIIPLVRGGDNNAKLNGQVLCGICEKIKTKMDRPGG